MVFNSTLKLMNYIGRVSVTGSQSQGGATSGFIPPQSGYSGTVSVKSDSANGVAGFADGEPWYFMKVSPPWALVSAVAPNEAAIVNVIFPQVKLDKAAQTLTWFYPQRSFTTTALYYYGNAIIFYGIR